MTVQTNTVTGRRSLQFSSYQEILDDARKLSLTPTRQLGNWSLGQICEHLAKGMDMAIDGPAFKPSLPVRLIGPFFKKRTLTRPMSPGFTLPKNAAALLPAPVSVAEGLAKLEKSIARQQQTRDRKPNPVFGPMTAEEWDQLNFRHAEMHLSFIVSA
ncbi:MAG: DUF1569 domain-containing protein [Planctomycetia bacterium]|nr:DUF1569 domain-containing protein [Planctomycetia bacterium]